MKVYNLRGYYDLTLKNYIILLPKIWRRNWKILIKKRSVCN